MKHLNKNFSLFLIALLVNIVISAQSTLYMPRDIQKSYDNGVRSYDGKPGKNYWQNNSDYKIKAELFPGQSILKGEESITYHNNSPDTLKSMVIRLYGDIYKKGAARDWYRGTADITNGVELDYLIIGKDTINLDGSTTYRGSTNLFARLTNPLPPNSQTEVKTKWTIEIPDTFQLRMGNYGDNDFFIAYWYPQIAVYDDIAHWDDIDYTGIAEFYNDFNNYNIEITVPDNLVIWGVGNLQNPEKVFTQTIIDKINQAKQSDETVRIITRQDYKNNDVTLKNGKNVWKFSATKVTDFSFAVSDNFNWDAASIEVDKSTGRRVLTSAVYPDSTIHWENAAQYARATIKYMSEELPGVPYPYPHTTTFCNKKRGGGMETPMMANNGAPKNKGDFIGLIFHEISHSYFPFYMGTNERKYGWMDEGWATFFPGIVVDSLVPGYDYYRDLIRGYEYFAGKELELPMMIPTFGLPTQSSGTASYSRPGIAYMELQKLLGNDLFKKTLQKYIYLWHEKHPIPYDFFFTFNNVAGEDLSWFWNPWFYDMGYPDLAVKEIEKTKNGYTAVISKVGTMPTAVEVTFTFADSSKQNVSKTPLVWKDADIFHATVKSNKKLIKVELGSPYIPDANKKNNTKQK